MSVIAQPKGLEGGLDEKERALRSISERWHGSLAAYFEAIAREKARHDDAATRADVETQIVKYQILKKR